MAEKKTTQTRYGIHPAVAHMQAMARNLSAKTGKDLAAWIAVLEKDGPAITKERQAWLKDVHGLGRDTAMTIIEYAEGRGEYDPDGLVEAMFTGPKAGLRPLYERMLEVGLATAPDVFAAPCSTYVPFMRKRQFAVLKPTTRTRLDLGLALGATPCEGRLVAAKNLGSDKITHRIGLERVEDIDAEVERWLRAAYEADAK